MEKSKLLLDKNELRQKDDILQAQKDLKFQQRKLLEDKKVETFKNNFKKEKK
jgi:hypothetical protein